MRGPSPEAPSAVASFGWASEAGDWTEVVRRVEPVPSQPLGTVRASWYGPGFAGRPTANGEVFDPSQLTTAHPSLPFGSKVRVTNMETGTSVVVRVNDRGPFVPGRALDLSEAAAARLDLLHRGVAPVELELLRP